MGMRGPWGVWDPSPCLALPRAAGSLAAGMADNHYCVITLPLCCCRRFFVSAALAIVHVTNQVCYLGALLQQLKLNKATEKDCMNFSERLQP